MRTHSAHRSRRHPLLIVVVIGGLLLLAAVIVSDPSWLGTGIDRSWITESIFSQSPDYGVRICAFMHGYSSSIRGPSVPLAIHQNRPWIPLSPYETGPRPRS